MRSGRCGRKRKNKQTADRSRQSLAEKDQFVAIKQWIRCQDNACKIDLEPCLFPDIGRGLGAKKSINKGEILLSLPKSVLITPTTALVSDRGKILKQFHPPLSPQRMIAVFLVYERTKDKKSSWYPYLYSLPESFSTPAYFSSEELCCLPPRIRVRAHEQIRRLRQIYGSIHNVLRSLLGSTEVASFTYESFRWAWNVVNTRSVYLKTPESPHLSLTDGESNVALAPYLDLLNHSTSANIEAGLNPETDRYEVKTFDKYKKYEQVFICYNQYSNEQLFLEYGFTLPDNPCNVYEFTLESVQDLKAVFSLLNWTEKLSVIQEHGFSHGLFCSKDGLSWKLHSTLRILAMSWTEVQKWQAVYQGEISEENETIALQMAKFIVQAALTATKKLLVNYKENLTVHEQLASTLVDDDHDILQVTLGMLM